MTVENAIWRAIVLTLFPEMFPGPLGHSLAGKALEDGLWALEACSIRDWAVDKPATVDDTPFGGGSGMVMRADVVDAALCAVVDEVADAATPQIIYLTPRGQPLTQERVATLAGGPGVILVCGRYEGIDERVVEAWNMEEVSIGDFVLSGGEPAAMALIDATVRLLPGVIGSEESCREESFEGGLLEHPHYTKPRVWRDREVPGILLSGHHGKVDAWRKAEAEKATEKRRPDLWHRYAAKNL